MEADGIGSESCTVAGHWIVRAAGTLEPVTTVLV
jgi:hypothetical protein